MNVLLLSTAPVVVFELMLKLRPPPDGSYTWKIIGRPVPAVGYVISTDFM